MMDNDCISRSIEIYYKDEKKYGDLLVIEYDLPASIRIEDLKNVFSIYKLDFINDPLMCNIYPIQTIHINYLKQYINIDFNFDMYVYYLSCGINGD